jgi:hypothetical protein
MVLTPADDAAIAGYLLADQAWTWDAFIGAAVTAVVALAVGRLVRRPGLSGPATRRT